MDGKDNNERHADDKQQQQQQQQNNTNQQKQTITGEEEEESVTEKQYSQKTPVETGVHNLALECGARCGRVCQEHEGAS